MIRQVQNLIANEIVKKTILPEMICDTSKSSINRAAIGCE